MIAPLVPYAIRGCIWYQGESDAGWKPQDYDERINAMFSDWRAWWDQDQFAIGIVQLAGFQNDATGIVDSKWAHLRNSQRLAAQQLDNEQGKAGLAVAIDIGEGNDIHPQNKRDVARRLARWALSEVYELITVGGSPEPMAWQRENDQITITFAHTADGLEARHGETLSGFSIAGSDQVFVAAEATITDAHTLSVHSPEIANPLHVRYAWEDRPDNANLQNSLQLPAGTFELTIEP